MSAPQKEIWVRLPDGYAVRVATSVDGFAVFFTRHPPSLIDADDRRLARDLDSLGLLTRTANCLQNAGLRRVGEVVERSEASLLALEYFGGKSLRDLKDRLGEIGLGLGMRFNVTEKEAP